MSPSFDVIMEVAVQQHVKDNGTMAANLNLSDTFALSSMQLSWRGDSAFLATTTQAEDECAFLSMFLCCACLHAAVSRQFVS